MTISYSDNFLRLMRRWKGSIWKACWKELGIFLALYYIFNIAYRLGSNEFRFGFEKIVVQFKYFVEKTPITWFLGFYVTSVVQRWWHQFESIPWPEDLLSVTCHIIPNSEKDPDAKLKRQNIARYVILSMILCWRDVSHPVFVRFPTLEHLVQAKLMTLEESQMYDSTGTKAKWFLPLQWAQKIVEKQDGIAAPLQGTFLSSLIAYRASLRKLYCFDWVCIPLVYTQVAALVTYSYLAMSVLGRQYLSEERKLKDFEADLYLPIFSILELIFYVGWFKVAKYLMRPFGSDDDDIELNYLLDRNIQVAAAVVDELYNQQPQLSDTPIFNKPKAALPHTQMSLNLKDSEHPPRSHMPKLTEKEEHQVLVELDGNKKLHNDKIREF